LLVDNYDVPELHTCVPKEHAQLFDMANRGGLSAPTQLCFAMTAIAVQLHLHRMIWLKKKLTMSNQRFVFTTAVSEVVGNDFHETLLKQQCSAGHFIF